MSDTAQGVAEALGSPPGGRVPASSLLRRLRAAAILATRQREATVLVVVVLMVGYFGLERPSTFFSSENYPILSQIAGPIAIIAIGEVLLLICGEIDLSPGFVYLFAPFLMHYLIDYYSFPVIPAIGVVLLMGALVGWVNGFLVVKLAVPSFIATLGTGFILLGITLTTSNATQASIPVSAVGIGKWIGSYSYAEIAWAIALVAVFHIVLTRTRWGLHTIATGSNQLGAREAGINVARIKYGSFMICAVLGAFVGLQIAFQTSVIDPSSGGYGPMFSAVTAAVIGGTAMLGGSGTIIGAFLGSVMLAVLTDGFDVMGISAYPIQYITGAAILIAMIANVQLARLRGSGRKR